MARSCTTDGVTVPFSPHFAKSLAEFKGFSTINTRAESIMKSAMWRVPFQRRRCLVPADGFYEWKKIDPKTKQPYAFAMTDGEPFAFAGLWDVWKEPDGGWPVLAPRAFSGQSYTLKLS
jgi:putative SOS response-associated peptidase YedK